MENRVYFIFDKIAGCHCLCTGSLSVAESKLSQWCPGSLIRAVRRTARKSAGRGFERGVIGYGSSLVTSSGTGLRVRKLQDGVCWVRVFQDVVRSLLGDDMVFDN